MKAILNKLTLRQQKGYQAEQAARKYLEKQNFVFLQANFHSRHGEIDLIMQDADAIVFVEVRYRANEQWGSALESIDSRKQERIKKTALHYLHKNNAHESAVRFDVIAMQADNDKPLEINWVKNAF
ncbi:MAG: YraN family protein [Gammaproteobacteria bacterium]|nr:YraN family protein [Gammaproteobacteria bacterium]